MSTKVKVSGVLNIGFSNFEVDVDDKTLATMKKVRSGESKSHDEAALNRKIQDQMIIGNMMDLADYEEIEIDDWNFPK